MKSNIRAGECLVFTKPACDISQVTERYRAQISGYWIFVLVSGITMFGVTAALSLNINISIMLYNIVVVIIF